MKPSSIFLALFLWLSSYSSWAQVESRPLTFTTTVTGDGVHNFSGGLQKGSAYAGNVDLTMQLSTEKAGLWKGGELYLHGLNIHGALPSTKLIGDIQPVSRLEASSRTTLFECWYRQKVGSFSFLLGQHNMNAAFAVNQYAKFFLNTSFGMYPSIALNVPLSIYPVGAAAVVMKWEPSETFSVQAAVYDGAPLGVERSPHNLNRDLHLDRAAFSTVEFAYHYRNNGVVTGSYKLGGFYHSAHFADLSDTATTYVGNRGFYLCADQQVWREKADSEQGLGAFLQAGTAPGRQNLVNVYLSGGLFYRGLFPKRHTDKLGLGLVHSSLNHAWVTADPLRYSQRTMVELTYKAQLGNYFAVQPDLQYIIHPGANRAVHNALVGILRWSLTY